MDFFFFGSLMDREVAELVLGRPLDDAAAVTARLHGFVRLTVVGESYPALVPRAGGEVAGVLRRLDRPGDLQRLQFFEGEEFAPQVLAVEAAGGARVRARVFVASETLRCSELPWDYGRWLRHEKQDFLALTRAWMAQFGYCTPQELEPRWQAEQRARLRARDRFDLEADLQLGERNT